MNAKIEGLKRLGDKMKRTEAVAFKTLKAYDSKMSEVIDLQQELAVVDEENEQLREMLKKHEEITTLDSDTFAETVAMLESESRVEELEDWFKKSNKKDIDVTVPERKNRSRKSDKPHK